MQYEATDPKAYKRLKSGKLGKIFPVDSLKKYNGFQ